MDIINIKIKEIDDLIRLQLWDNLNKIIIRILLIKIKIMNNNHMFMIKLILILKIEVILDKICTIQTFKIRINIYLNLNLANNKIQKIIMDKNHNLGQKIVLMKMML